MSVSLDPADRNDISSVLYLLHDGVVDTIDVARGFDDIVEPVFLRSPVAADDPPALYWVRYHQSISASTAQPQTTVARLSGEGTKSVVRVSLRHGEGVSRIDGYPGGRHFTIHVARSEADPSFYEVLSNQDPHDTSASPTYWSAFASRANTDANLSAVWLSPFDYAVFDTSAAFNRYIVRSFRAGCEYDPSGVRVVYDGRDLADNDADFVSWDPVALPPDRVLVVKASDIAPLDVGHEQRRPEPTFQWSTLSIATGEVESTQISWREGPWTWVAGDEAAPDTKLDCTSGKEVERAKTSERARLKLP